MYSAEEAPEAGEAPRGENLQRMMEELQQEVSRQVDAQDDVSEHLEQTPLMSMT